MQFISVFIDIAKVSDLQWKNTDVHDLYILGSSLGKVNLCQVSSL